MLLDIGMEGGVRVEDGEDVGHDFISARVLPRGCCEWEWEGVGGECVRVLRGCGGVAGRLPSRRSRDDWVAVVGPS